MNMLKEHKRFKEQEQLEFDDLDRNISNNLGELNKIRQEAEERKKEQKRQEIVDRMKKNEMRKMNEQKKVRANNKYVTQLRTDTEVESRAKIPLSPPSNRRVAENAAVIKQKSP